MFFTLSFFELPLSWVLIGTLIYITLNYLKLTDHGPFFSGGVLTTMVASRFYARLFFFGAISYLFQPKLWYGAYYIGGNFLVMTPSVALFHVVLLFLISILFYTGMRYVRFKAIKFFEYPFLLASMSILFLFLCMAYDYFVLFLIFESITLLFVLTIGGLRGLHKKQILAAFFYFLFNIAASLLYLLGSFSIFVMGLPNTFYISYELNSSMFVYFGLLCFILFFCFKLSIFPLHWWTPLIYEKAPLLTLMYLAIPSKLAIIYIFIKILYFSFAAFSFFWSPVLIILSLFSMTIGALALAREQRLRKFWGYSTINHMGYILLGLSTDSLLGIKSSLFYVIAYLTFNLIFFYIYQNLFVSTTKNVGLVRVTFINELASCNLHQDNMMFTSFSLLLFSLIGIPPLFGFWSKYYIIVALFSSKLPIIYFYCSLGIVISTTLITSFAYLNIWKTIYAELPKQSFFLFFNQLSVRLILYFTGIQLFVFIFLGKYLNYFYIFLERFVCLMVFL